MEMLKQGEIKMTQDSQTNVMVMEDDEVQRSAFRGLEAKTFMHGLVRITYFQMFRCVFQSERLQA